MLSILCFHQGLCVHITIWQPVHAHEIVSIYALDIVSRCRGRCDATIYGIYIDMHGLSHVAHETTAEMLASWCWGKLPI